MKDNERKAAWELLRRKSWSGFTSMTNRMVDSEAFEALRSVHSVKVLVWFWQMAQYAKEKRKPGQESPIGNLRKILNAKDLSFEYRIAAYRGMRPDQFVYALRELFRYGFLDIEHHGRGIKGDWTRYAYSDRWKSYGTPQWAELPFPIADRVGWRKKKKNYYANPELPTTLLRSYKAVEMGNDYGIAELKTPVLTDPVTTTFRSPSRIYQTSEASPSVGKVKKRGAGKGKSNPAHSRNFVKPEIVFSRTATPEEVAAAATWT
jgi:hypothetical protein